MQKILCGQTIEYTDETGADGLTHRRKGAVLIENGYILDVGEADILRKRHPTAETTDYGDFIIAPGFVDCHNHYPQTRIIASWGKRLIDWLNEYTFPEEARFFDKTYASAVAKDYLNLLTSNGITSAATYSTIHPESVDALFEAASARNMRFTAGKVMMDRNAPDNLRDTAQTGYDHSKALINKWSGHGRLSYAITPRFAPTSTEQQLEAAGALWAEHPECPMQTHLSEQVEEISWVADLFPDDQDYLAVYQRHGLCGPGAIMGHSIHLTDRERGVFTETGAGIAHCPTSNMFIGSGLCDVAGLREANIPIGLATDVGGGSSFSMFSTMRSAYEVGQLRGNPTHPADLWKLSTIGSAETMRLGDKIGRLAPGYEADLIVIDPHATPVLSQRTARANSISDLLFALIILGDDRAIASVWINGEMAQSDGMISDIDRPTT
ncbi:MAG: guanine deaminase [Pikeienuella sp.]